MARKIDEKFNPFDYLDFIKEQAKISAEMKRKVLKENDMSQAVIYHTDETTYRFLADDFEYYITKGVHR